MSYLTAADIKDDEVKAIVTDATAYLTDADQWFQEVVARARDVQVANIKTNPLPYWSKRALEFWVCVEVSIRMIGHGMTQTASGTVTDWWKSKLEKYQVELAKALENLTQYVIMGIDAAGYPDDSEDTSSYGRA